MLKEYKNCKICGRVFFKTRYDICPECKRIDDEKFQLVRQFLKEFPGSKINIVSEYTGVSERRILRYLREGKIQILDSDQNFLTCLKCGTPIKTGKYCSQCYRRFCDTVKKLYANPETSNDKSETEARMRFLNRNK